MAVRKRISGGVLAIGVLTFGLVVAAPADAVPSIGETVVAETATAQLSTAAKPAVAVAATGVPCNKFIARDHPYRNSGFIFTTDGKGRPIGATGKVTRHTRGRTPCESKVGRWGGRNYQGSHLIAATLNGISRRYNLVPATREVNQVLMKAFENAAKKCLIAGNDVIYTVAAGYRNEDVIPENFAMKMTIGVQQVHVGMNFKNKHYGRAFMTRKRLKLANDLRAANCAG